MADNLDLPDDLLSTPKVAQQDTATSSQNLAIEETHTFKFTWKIQNFSSLGNNKIFSNSFEVGGYKWRILLFPRGNCSDNLSMYLDVADSEKLPREWKIDTQFQLALINQLNSEWTVRKELLHKFLDSESDWGLTSFMPLRELDDSSRGFRVNDTCIIEADVAVTHHYTVIKITRDCDLGDQIGKDIYFDLVDHQRVRDFRIQKYTSFNLFKEMLAKEFGVPVQFQRFWIWEKRQNQTYRPSRPLTSPEEKLTVGQLSDLSKWTENKELRLFLEVEFHPDGNPVCPPDKTKDDILLFFKLYDPKHEELRYIGRLFVKSYCKPSEILTKLNNIVGFHANEELKLYEEIKFEPSVMCIPVANKVTWTQNEVQDGDIICFQKASSEEIEKYRYLSVPLFLQYVHTHEVTMHAVKMNQQNNVGDLLDELKTQVDVLETLGHAEAKVEPATELKVVPGIEKSHDHRPHGGPLAVLLAKKARVSPSASPQLSKASGTPPSVVPPSSSPQQHIMTNGCVDHAIQTADVTVGQALKSGLESFSSVLQAVQNYKIQFDIQSKMLDNLKKANISLSIAKAKAEDSLKTAEKKTTVVEAESAALKTELEELQAKERSWEAQLKAQKGHFEAELSSVLESLQIAKASTKAKEAKLAQEKASRASEACCKKTRKKALEEFGAEVGGLVNQYHLACHIRSLTLAGLEPKDPRWYDVVFPIEGPTPPLKFPWEDESGSAAN